MTFHQRVRVAARTAFAVASLAIAGAAPAHPVTYKGNLMLMGEAGQKMQDYSAGYTFAADKAVSAGWMYFQSDRGDRDRRIPNVHLSYLAKRWNLPEAQANIYLQAGMGDAAGSDFRGSKTTFMPGFQADYETQHVYVAYKWHGFKASGFSHSFNQVEGGFSLYAGEYDEVSPWLMLQVRRMSNFDSKTEITPTLRLVRKNVFFEIGVSTERSPRINLMFNF